jgi:hypothetical protein
MRQPAVTISLRRFKELESAEHNLRSIKCNSGSIMLESFNNYGIKSFREIRIIGEIEAFEELSSRITELNKELQHQKNKSIFKKILNID